MVVEAASTGGKLLLIVGDVEMFDVAAIFKGAPQALRGAKF
jgi:hypothetical protein